MWELGSRNELDGFDLIVIEVEDFEMGKFDLREMIEGQLLLIA